MTQQEFEKTIDTSKISQPMLSFFLIFKDLKKCPFCKTKYPEGIMRDDNAGKIRELAWMIKSDVLVHIQTTHGYTPEDLTMMFKQLKEENK